MESTTNKHQSIPLTLLFLFLSPEIFVFIGAQTEFGEESPPISNLSPNSYQSFRPFFAILIVGFVTSLCFMVVFMICHRYYYGVSSTVIPTVPHHPTAVISRGLDRLVIETFPIFLYSEVKDHQIGKAGNGILECAVCLNEFEDDETLRLIPKCDHVFHPECIDAWLESHVTCPVCRADLVPKPGDDEPVLIPVDRNEDDVINDQVAIQIDDEFENQHLNRRKEMNRNLSFQYPKSKHQRKEMNRNLTFQYSKRPQRSWSFQKLRSSSTGHLLVQPGEDVNRFTLRLPDVVKKEVIDRALLNRTCSFATITEDGCDIETSESEVKSERWNFFARALSMKLRSPREIEESSGSTSKGGGNRTPVRMVSFKCLEPIADDDDDSRVRLRPAGPFKAE